MSRRDLIEVRPRDGHLSDQDIRKFTKMFRDSGLRDELRERSGYDKPSIKRRKKRLRAIFRQQEELKNEPR